MFLILERFRSISRKTFSGLLFLAIGLVLSFVASSYPVGTLTRMGPGFFPLCLSVLLAFLALIILFSPKAKLMEETEQPDPQIQTTPLLRWRGISCIILGLLAFIFLGEYLGLVPAAFFLVFISALGDRDQSIKSALLLALGTTVIGVLLFSWVLQLQLPMFKWS